MIAKYLLQKLVNRNIPLVNQSAELFCNINFPIWRLILVNFLIDLEVTRCNGKVVLQNVAKNSIDWLYIKKEISRKMEAKGSHILTGNQKGTVDISWTHNKERRLAECYLTYRKQNVLREKKTADYSPVKFVRMNYMSVLREIANIRTLLSATRDLIL